MARIRALDEQPGIACVGVQLASHERTRHYQLSSEDGSLVETVMEGVYEDIPLRTRIRSACEHLRKSEVNAIIVDTPADPVQWILGSVAHRGGALALTRWAATVSDHPRRPWKEFLKRFVYRGWDHYLVTGQRGLEYLRTFGVPDTRATICGNPVAAAPIENARAMATATRESSFLFVGRFLALKNLDRFLGAYLRYRREGGTWSLKVGGTGEPDDVARLKKIAGGDPAIEFLGHLQFDALQRAYLREGALVLPSYSENWGLVVNEAMHAGMPILLSRTCGCFPDLFREGENGFSMAPFDETSICHALAAMEKATAEERSMFGQVSSELIAEHTPERWAERVAEVVRGGQR
jgi:glycosyltransferase involved in cell wall biosynthesis